MTAAGALAVRRRGRLNPFPGKLATMNSAYVICAASGIGALIVAQVVPNPEVSVGSQSVSIGVAIAIGSGVGAALAAAITAAGNSFFRPWLEQRGYKSRLDETAARLSEAERKAGEAAGRLDALEADRLGLIGKLEAALQASSALTDKNIQLAHNLLVVAGRQRPGLSFRATEILIDDGVPASAGPKVLLVEDNPQSAEATRGLLELARFRVRSVGTCVDAVEALDSFAPDFVILDLMLPDCDGIDVLKKVRDRNLPCVVIVTTGKSGRDLDDVRALRPEVLLRKPFDFANDVLPVLRGVRTP